MKADLITSTIAAAVLAVANVPSARATSIVAGAPTCTCTAQCAAYGDPEIIDFNGQTWKQTGTSLTLYSVDSFSVTAQTGAQSRITTVSFGTKTYNSINDCQQEKQSFSDVENLAADGVVSIELVCYLESGEYIFDVYLNKTDTGSVGDFQVLEQNTGASGLCETGQTSSRRLRGVDTHRIQTRALAETNISPPSCVCESTCQAIGDPEVYGFYGGEQTVTTAETLSLYISEGFSVKVGIQDERIKTLYFGSETYQSSTVCQSTSSSLSLEYTWEDGNKMGVLAQCEEASGSNGFFFNVALTKQDVVSSETPETNFKSMETSEGASGLCLI